MGETIENAFLQYRKREYFFDYKIPQAFDLFGAGLDSMGLEVVKNAIITSKIRFRYLNSENITDYSFPESGLSKQGVAGVNSIIIAPKQFIFNRYGFIDPFFLKDREIVIKDNSPEPLFDLLHEFWHLMTDGFLYRLKSELADLNIDVKDGKYYKIYTRIISINEGFTEFMSQINRGLILENPKLGKKDANAYTSEVKFISYLMIKLHLEIKKYRHISAQSLHKSLIEFTAFGGQNTYFYHTCKNYLGIDFFDLRDENQDRIIDLYYRAQSTEITSQNWLDLLNE